MGAREPLQPIRDLLERASQQERAGEPEGQRARIVAALRLLEQLDGPEGEQEAAKSRERLCRQLDRVHRAAGVQRDALDVLVEHLETEHGVEVRELCPDRARRWLGDPSPPPTRTLKPELRDASPNAMAPEDPDAAMEELLEEVKEFLREGYMEDDDIGISLLPDHLQIVVTDDAVTADYRGLELSTMELERPLAEQVADTEDLHDLAITISEELFLFRDAGQSELVDHELARLRDTYEEPLEARIRSNLADALSQDALEELWVRIETGSYDYRHGDPMWVYEQDYPPFLVVVRGSQDGSRVEAAARIEHDGGEDVNWDPETLADQAAKAFLEAWGDA